MCDCGPGAGSSRRNPLTLGAPTGTPVLVTVVTPFAGLWKGTAWVRGSEVAHYIAKGFIRT